MSTSLSPSRYRLPSFTSEKSRVPGYDYAAPTEATVLASLQRVFGVERGRESWVAACLGAGLAVGSVHNPDALQRATSMLSAQGGAAATVARSITIRAQTHARLLARSGATSTVAVR